MFSKQSFSAMTICWSPSIVIILTITINNIIKNIGFLNILIGNKYYLIRILVKQLFYYKEISIDIIISS
jgi:hypothetical protein